MTRVERRSNGQLRFRLAPNLTTATGSLVLVVDDDKRFAFAHANVKQANNRRWNNAGLTWQNGTVVDLKLVEGSTVATLASLEVKDEDDTAIILTPPFAVDTLLYTLADVENAVEEITILAEASDSGARIKYFDESDSAIADGDTNIEGHQVSLAVGNNTIKVQVTAEDGVTVRTYTVTVARGEATTTCLAPNLTGRTQIWTGTVTVGANEVGGVVGAYGFGSGFGALDETEFSVGTNDYTVERVSVETSASPLAGLLKFGLTSALATADSEGLTLHVCDASFAFADAVLSNALYNYLWYNSGLDWSSDTSRTLYLSVPSGNTVPTAADKTVTTDEDTAYTFAAADFNFLDVDSGDGLASVRVVTLPAVGALALDGAAVSVDQVVAEADIAKLTFTPALNANGLGYASFTFKVSDGTDESASAYTMTVNVTPVNDAATGAPEITGTPQVGQALTAGMDTIADAEDLPTTTFPLGYSFQWVRVDSLNNGTNVGTDSSTYSPLAADEGSTIRVDVSFTDGAGNSETVPSDAVGPVAPAAGACITGYDWCTTMTVGERRLESLVFYGFTVSFGQLDDMTIDYGPSYGVVAIQIVDTGIVVVDLSAFVPRGSVFGLGGTEFTVDADSEQLSQGLYNWDLPAGFTWIDGQKVTVSANLAPAPESATVDGTTLVLTHSEDLDTGSTPAAGSYTVKLDGGTGPVVSSVSVDVRTVTLTLATPVTAADINVTVDYDAPVSSPLQDVSGLDAPDSEDFEVTNNTLSTDATLSALTVNDGTTDLTLAPAFVSATIAYTTDVASSVEEVTLTAETTDTGASVSMVTLAGNEIADDDFTDGMITVPSLAEGANVIVVTVTAEDATTMKTYMVTVTREATTSTDPVWSTTMTVAQGTSNNRGYNSYNTGTMVGVLLDDQLTVSGVDYDVEVLDVGSNLGVSLFIKPSLPGSDDLILEWAGVELPLADATDSFSYHRWIPEWLTVNASSLGPTNFETTLPVGGMVRVCLRTATQVCPEGGTTLSTDATLSELTVSDGTTDLTLVPAFVSDTIAYTTDVASSVEEVTLTAETTDTGASVSMVTLAGNEIADDDFTDGMITVPSLVEGANVIVVTVTAEDDATTQTYTVTVTRETANTVPTAADNTVTTDEDTAYTFAASDFNFDDTDTGDGLVSVTLVTLPAAGALELGGAPVTVDEVVAEEDIGTLVFTPAANANGSGYASFTFKVSDGTDESASAYTMTVDVTPVNDAATGAPEITGTPQVGEELTAVIGTIDDAEGRPGTFPDDYTFQWVVVDGLTETDITGETESAYTPADTDVGKSIKVKVSFTDDEGNLESPLVSGAVGPVEDTTPTNTLPVVVNAIPDQAATVGTAFSYDFPAETFNDDDGDTLTYTATKDDGDALPSWLTFDADTRTFSGTPVDADVGTVTVKVTADDGAGGTVSDEFNIVVSAVGICGRTEQVRVELVILSPVTNCANVTDTHLADIDILRLTDKGITTLAAGDFAGLTSLSSLLLNNNDLSTLPARVFDGLTELDYLYLNDNDLTSLPEGVFNSLTGLENLFLNNNRLRMLSAEVFDSLTALKNLYLQENRLNASGLPTGVFDKLAALERLDLSSISRNGLASLPEGVFDELTALSSLLLNNNDLATLPAGVFDELTALTDLDLQNNPGAPFSPVAVALPDDGMISDTGGMVELIGSGSNGGPWGTNVTYGWALTDPASGVTVDYDPDETSSDTTATVSGMLTSVSELVFTLTVTGRGGTDGIDPATDNATVTVTRETGNTVPTSADNTVTTNEDTAYTFSTADFNFLDEDSGDGLVSVTLVTLPAAGALALDGAAVSVGEVVAAANIGKLTFTPALNANGLGYASFTFKVSDDTDESASDYTMTVNVTPVNDSATGAPEITGTPQVGQALTAGLGAIDDDDSLPTTAFPTGYSFQWVRVAGSIETNVGTDSSTYSPTSSDEDSTIKVKVSFTDGAGNLETRPSDAVGPVAPAAGACITSHDWCATMTVGVLTDEQGDIVFVGFSHTDTGALDPGTISYGGKSFNTTKVSWAQGNPLVDLEIRFGGVPQDETLFRGSVFRFDEIERTEETGKSFYDITGHYAWNDLPTDFGWIDGQKVTVSANLSPAPESATVDGTTLVLTHAEDLDTGSTPAAGAYTVKVDGSAGPTVSSVLVGVRTVTLTLATAVTADTNVTVDYDAPVSSPLQDESGLDAPDFEDFEVTNDSTNSAPTVATSIPDQAATVGTAFSYTFPANTFTDADNDPLTYTATKDDDNALPPWLTFDDTTRTFSGTPADADVGTVTVKVTADDGAGGTVSDEFDIEVSASNSAPTVANAIPDQAATVGTAFSYTFPANTFTDADNDPLTYTATKDDDNALPSWLTFADTSRTFSGTPADADVGTVTVKVTADDGAGGTVSDEFDIEVASLPVLSFAETVVNVNETDGTAALTVNLNPASAGQVTVDFATSDRDAFADEDYTAQSGTLEFMANETSKTITIPITDDNIHEPDEEIFQVALTNPSGATVSGGAAGTAQIRITSDDAEPVASMDAVTVNEGAGTMTLVLKLDRPSSEQIVYATDSAGVGGTATVSEDYVDFLGGTIDFRRIDVSAGEIEGTLYITIINDSEAEAAETITIVWGKTVDIPATPEFLRFTGTITDNDGAAATGQPEITGTPRVGEELTADKGTVTDTDGTTKADNGDVGYAYTYEWILVDGVNETDIAGATENIYVPSASDEGKQLKVRVSFTDDGDNAETATSDPYPAGGTILAGGGICDRTPEVRDYLVDRISAVSDCAEVTDEHLAGITGELQLQLKNISALKAGDFAGLEAATVLILTANDLTTLPVGVFDELGALATLQLTGNRLTTLPAGLFAGLEALERLILDGNSLPTLSAELFAGLGALKTLNLSGNQLTMLPAGLFAGLDALERLFLNDNLRLTMLPEEVFAELDALRILNLSNISLNALPEDVFAGLDALEELYLSENALNTLPDGVFEPLTALTELELQDNPGAPFSPVAVAKPDDGTVPITGGMVELRGSDSHGGPWGTNVTYGWALTDPASGVDVTFDDDTSDMPQATIPALLVDTELTFTLTVTGRGDSSSDTGDGVQTGSDTATVIARDTTAPQVTSITRQTPTTSPTNADSLTWRITFDEDVENVDAADFTVDGATATPVVNVVTASTVYDVTASAGNLADLNGTVTLSFAGGQDITDTAGTALSNPTPTGTNENSYVVDNTAPTVEITDVPATSGAPFTATFTFSEEVTGFALGDIAVGNGAASAFTPTSTRVYTALITPAADGEVTVDVAKEVVTDEAGNGNTAATQATSTYTAPVTNSPPTVANAISDQAATVGTEFGYQFPADTFNDADGDTLSYMATKDDDNALPPWLTFDAATRTFSGAPMDTDVGTFTVKVTASDGEGGTVSDEFNLEVALLPVLSFAETRVDVDEIDGSVELTLNLAPASAGTVTADYETSDDTAEAGEDYTAHSGTLTFTAGETSKTITILITNDDIHEADVEFLSVVVSSADGATVSRTAGSANIWITSDDSEPTARMADVTVVEGAGTMKLTLELDRPSSEQILYSTSSDDVGGTATVSEDYADFLDLGFAHIELPPGELTQDFDIAIIDDGAAESDETITIKWTKTSATQATPDVLNFTGTITDNDGGAATGKPAITGTPRVGEVLTATLGSIADTDDLPTTPFPVGYTFQWVSVDSTNNVTDIGTNSNTYTVLPTDVDSTIRVDVSFTDGAGNPEGPLSSAAVGPVVAVLPVLSFAETRVEVNETDGSVELTVNLAPASAGTVTVDYATSDLGAKAGEDYTAHSGTLIFAPNETLKTITIQITDDAIHEADVEIFYVNLTDSSGATLSGSAKRTLIYITSDDPEPIASMDDETVDEGAGTMKVTLRLNRPSSKTIKYSASLGNVGGTATVSEDYADFLVDTDFSVIQVPAGDLSADFDITIIDDEVAESDETITIGWRKSNISQVSPTSLNFIGTITDNDEPEETPPNGSLRLVLSNDVPISTIGAGTGEGRLEMYFKKKKKSGWGTVCDDGFDSKTFTIYGPNYFNGDRDDKQTVDNIAPELACQLLGHETGEMVSRSSLGMSLAPEKRPIWLDDVRCAAESTPESTPGLQHCYHAGVGLHNCGTRNDPDHEEDVHLACVPIGTTRAALTAEFQQAPESHIGEEFSFRIAFSAPVDLEGQDLVNGPLMLTGAQPVRVALVDGRYDLLEVFVNPVAGRNVSIGLESGHPCYRRPTETDPHLPGAKWTVCTRELYTQDGTAADVGLPLPLSQSVSATVVGKPLLTAEFLDIPDSHGGIQFAVGVQFSEDLAPGFELPAPTDGLDVSSGVLDVSNARIDSIVQGLSGDPIYLIRLTPIDLGEPVRIVLLARHPCNFAGAACTPDGRRLSGTLTITVPAGAVIARSIDAGPAPLTAWFKGVPAEHDGENEFPVELWFSEPPAGPGWYGARNIAVENAIDITGGAVVSARSIEQNGAHRRIVVQPSGTGAVTLSLPPGGPACDQAGALCTEAGGRLEVGALVQIQGPAALSVADAEVREGPGAALAFLVTLDRSTSAAVQVDYATRDGTAQAGSDYTANSGTLNFAPGETAKTVEVAVLDDSHDEGSETLTLVLSNPSGAYIEDGEATGTIENSDYMPQAWLGRFGRTVAEQVLDAVEERIRSAPRAGMQVTMAGHRFGGEATETEALEEAEARAWLETCRDGPGVGGDCPARTRSRAVTERDLLTGSSFALTTGADAIGGGLVSLWGRGAVSRFDGREGDLSLSGEVTGALLGADWTRERWTTGLMLSRTRGEGSYRGANSGEVSSTVTGLYPYGRYALTDRVTVWGAAGYGAGTLTLTPEDDETYETDMDLVMAAAGLRGVVVEAPADGGLELAVKTDALAVRTSSEATGGSAGGNLAAAEADVTRLRLGLEGTWRGLEIGTGTLAPRLEVGVRHDGGDAETGFGLDLGGGLAWSDPGTGIRAELNARGLLSHASDGFRDRGIAGSFGWDPTPDSDRGPSLTLSQTLGLSARGGADALLGRTTMAGLAANDPGNELERRRLEVKLGYGFGAFDDRFTATPEVGFGMSEGHRDYSLAWRLVRDRRRGDIGSLEFSLEARRRESANDPGSGSGAGAEPEYWVGFRLMVRF